MLFRSIRSYEKAGFRREGLLRDDVCIEGKYRDILWMAAVRPEKADEQGTTGGDTKYPAEVQI